MIRSYRAELTKLRRRRVVLMAAAVAVAFAIGSSTIILSAGQPANDAGPRVARVLTIEGLGAAGGGTAIFRNAVSFTGTFLFVVFVGMTAADFARGTIRTSLLRQPGRLGFLAGKLAAVLTFAAATLAVTEAVTWMSSLVQASGHGVDAGAWTSAAGAGAALTDFGAVMLWIAGYALLGAAVGTVLRSVPVALAAGIAWAGPVEHIVQNAWASATKVLPGLLLEAFAAGGTPEISAGAALVRAGLYAAAAAVIAAIVFARRDVTA